MIGFFECINDTAVARALFDHACLWAAARNLETLYGPFNLDYEDGYGILVEGRDRPPVLLCGHTPAYYHMRQPCRCLAIKSVLVLPEYWDTGVAVMLFHEMARRAIPKGYTWFDLSLTSDDNPLTPALAEMAGAKLYKQYQDYRLYLNEK